MTVKAGRDMLLKIDNKGSFVTVAGLRTRELVFSQQIIDVTDSGAVTQWRELLDTGTRFVRIRGEGIFRDGTSASLIRQNFLDADAKNWQVIIPETVEINSRFLISELAYAGNFSGEVNWRMTLQSAAAVTLNTVT